VRLLVSDLTAETARAGTGPNSPVWIVAAMAVGLMLSRYVPGLGRALNAVQVRSVSVPIAAGLLVMMYPVLAKVRYYETARITGDRRLMAACPVLNWVAGPALMFALAWLLLPDAPAYRIGLVVVGLARCIDGADLERPRLR